MTIKPKPGKPSPFPIGSPEHRALVNITKQVNRFWRAITGCLQFGTPDKRRVRTRPTCWQIRNHYAGPINTNRHMVTA